MALVDDKADALARAWSLRYGGEVITRNAALLLLAVADLETGMGEFRGIPGLQLLPGPSHNWGQIQRRQLTPDERASLAKGIIPRPRNDGEFLSGDVSPDTGAYHVWLCRFPDDVAGATRLIALLVDGEKLRTRIASMTPTEVAQTMYDARYYEGAHSRSEPGGPAKNVAAYAANITAHYQKLAGALGNWSPPNDDSSGSAGGSGLAVVLFLIALGGSVYIATRAG